MEEDNKTESLLEFENNVLKESIKALQKKSVKLYSLEEIIQVLRDSTLYGDIKLDKNFYTTFKANLILIESEKIRILNGKT